MRKLFIVNSRADSKALARFKAAYSKCSEEHPGESEVIYTEFAGHASEAARKATEENDLLVVACGGDGTIHEVANALAESRTPMAVIPQAQMSPSLALQACFLPWGMYTAPVCRR